MKGQQYEGFEDVHPLMGALIEEAVMAGAYGRAIARNPVRQRGFGALLENRRNRVAALCGEIGMSAVEGSEAPLAASIRMDFRLRSQ